MSNEKKLRSKLVKICIFVFIVVVGITIRYLLTANVTDAELIALFNNKLTWFVILVVATIIVILIVYFKIIVPRSEEESEEIEDYSEEVNWMKCSCGEIFPEKEVGLMKDFTYRPPKIQKICRFCNKVLEEVDDSDEHEDIIENIIKKKFLITVYLKKDIEAVTRFEKMLDLLTSKNVDLDIMDLDIKFNRNEKAFIATFISNKDNWDFGQAPKTVESFDVKEV